MQKITVIAVGADKEKYFADACAEYKKRLGRFAQTDLVILKDEPIPDDPSDAECAAVLRREGERMRAAIPAGFLVVALCIEGKELDSPALAGLLEDAANSYPGVCFLIGGSLGIDPEVKKLARVKLSMSRLTFPHRLARVMLMEALYRAASIRAGGRYHK